MTRKEERERKAKIRADQYSHPVEWNDCYHHWIEGAEWADKTMLDSIISYLNNININDYVSSITSGIGIINFDIKKLCDNIRNAMEE